MRTLTVSLGFTALLLSGCGETQEGGMVTSSGVLTAGEIAKTSALNAYDAVRIRRPAFLAPRSLNASTRKDALPAVYLNGLYRGDVESLREISILEIKEIRYIDAKDATLLYGADYGAGVIEVTTKIN